MAERVEDDGQTICDAESVCVQSRNLGFGLVFASGILRSIVDVIICFFHRPVALSHIEFPPCRPIPRYSPHLDAFIERGSQKSYWAIFEKFLYGMSCRRGTKLRLMYCRLGCHDFFRVTCARHVTSLVSRGAWRGLNNAAAARTPSSDLK